MPPFVHNKEVFMTAQRGDDVILKIGNAGTPETFSVIGGLRGTGFIFSGKSVDATHLNTQGWQTLLNQSGIRSAKIFANGLFTDSVSEALTRQLAFNQSLSNYQIVFGNGDVLQGSFKITNYARNGTHREVESYSLTLESAGEIAYTAG
jgi:TP901-1 family phage major tail protein